MIDSQVWPSMDASVYDDEDGDAYREVLKYLMHSREGIEEDTPEIPDMIIETVPEQRDVTKEELQDMIDGDFYYEQ